MEPYTPCELPIPNLDFARIITLVGEANAELARYDGLLGGIVNPSVLLSPLTTQEAVLSSKIEGTQATLDEVLEYETGIGNKEKEQDIHEVLNYRKTLILAAEEVKTRPITVPLIRQMHKILMDSVRGRDKTPGEFRMNQNWIGSPGCLIENATFVPPSPLVLNDYFQKWIQYVNGNDFDVLAQLAIVHAQFELLHPFNDGNGRIGRLLIPLFVYKKNALSSPMFYLSSYLESNRDEYYSALRSISKEANWIGWIEFFLNAVKIQAVENSRKVKMIMDLYEKMKSQIVDATHSQFSLKVLDAIFDKPIFTTSEFINNLAIPRQTATQLLKPLRENNILHTIKESSGRSPATLVFRELLNISEGGIVL